MYCSEITLKEKQEKCALEFKRYAFQKYASIRPNFWDDYFLLKFCFSKRFNLKETKKLFDDFVMFYMEHNVENIVEINNGNIEYEGLLHRFCSTHFLISKDSQPVIMMN